MSQNQPPKPSRQTFENESDVGAIANAQNKFAMDLYLTLTKSQSGNLFFSPFSISAVIAMAHFGTAGNTEEEVKKVLHFPGDKKSIERAYHDLISDYKIADPNFQFNAGHMSYIHDTLNVIESYTSIVKNAFFSTINSVNFEKHHQSITQEINEIVEKETKSKIKNLLAPGILNPLTRMVLVNYVYFKGNWVHPFRAAVENPFWVKPDSSISVPMMTIQKGFRMANMDELDARLLILEYQGERMNFAILLPNKRDGLTALEEKLLDANLSDLEKKATKAAVTVTIPKFKLEEEAMNLVETLQLMGITDLFSDSKCDLSGIANCKDIFVSHVIHKAFLNVDEKGTEAAAATAMVMMTRCALISEPTVFMADHPFLFYIRDKVSDAILFLGRCTNPKSGNA